MFFKKLCAAAMMTVAASSFAGDLVINGRSTKSYRDRDWDNDTGRFYRGDRGGRRDGGYRSPRYSETGEDRRPFGDSRGGDRRRRNSPKPYGYDSFMVTKNRDTADVEWLKNTEIRSDDDN